MKALKSMIRLERWELEERRRELLRIQSQVSSVETAREELDSEVVQQQAAITDDMEMIFAYGNYAQGVLWRRDQLAKEMEKLEPVVLESRDKVASAYQSVRRYEIILEGKQKREAEESQRQEQRNIDDISMDIYRRK